MSWGAAPSSLAVSIVLGVLIPQPECSVIVKQLGNVSVAVALLVPVIFIS